MKMKSIKGEKWKKKKHDDEDDKKKEKEEENQFYQINKQNTTW